MNHAIYDAISFAEIVSTVSLLGYLDNLLRDLRHYVSVNRWLYSDTDGILEMVRLREDGLSWLSREFLEAIEEPEDHDCIMAGIREDVRKDIILLAEEGIRRLSPGSTA